MSAPIGALWSTHTMVFNDFLGIEKQILFQEFKVTRSKMSTEGKDEFTVCFTQIFKLKQTSDFNSASRALLSRQYNHDF